MNGMNPEPCASYSLAGRFHCETCGETPQVVKAEGRDPIKVMLKCHGQTMEGSYTKEALTFTQYVFPKED